MPVLDIRAGDEWSHGSRDSSDDDMIGGDDGPLVPGLEECLVSMTNGSAAPGTPGDCPFTNGRVSTAILDDSDEELLQ